MSNITSTYIHITQLTDWLSVFKAICHSFLTILSFYPYFCDYNFVKFSFVSFVCSLFCSRQWLTLRAYYQLNFVLDISFASSFWIRSDNIEVRRWHKDKVHWTSRKLVINVHKYIFICTHLNKVILVELK